VPCPSRVGFLVVRGREGGTKVDQVDHGDGSAGAGVGGGVGGGGGGGGGGGKEQKEARRSGSRLQPKTTGIKPRTKDDGVELPQHATYSISAEALASPSRLLSTFSAPPVPKYLSTQHHPIPSHPNPTSRRSDAFVQPLIFLHPARDNLEINIGKYRSAPKHPYGSSHDGSSIPDRIGSDRSMHRRGKYTLERKTPTSIYLQRYQSGAFSFPSLPFQDMVRGVRCWRTI